jgi:shikimate dehydrogenase
MKNIIGIVAENLGHSLSPYIHNYWSKEYNQSFKYRKFEIAEKNLIKFFQNFKKNKNFKGFNVTIPYKTNFISLCDRITPKAKKIGSVNLVYKKSNSIIGDNTDVVGFAKSFTLLKKIKTKKVLLVGAGGAARSTLYYLNKKNIENIDVFATSFRRKEDICNDFAIKRFVTKVSLLKSKYDLIINSSSGGMVGKSPLNRNLIKLVDGAKGVIDIVYNPETTPLLNRAEKNNIPFVGGLTMLIEQAKPSYEKWSNKKIKVDDEIYQLARNKLK